MPIDPMTWIIIVILLIILMLLLRMWVFRPPAPPPPPWVVFDSIGKPERTTQDQCGDGSELITANMVENLNLHVEVENRGKCKVELFIGTNKFLTARAPTHVLGGVEYRAAFVTLPVGSKITYICASDTEATDCIFRAKITAR